MTLAWWKSNSFLVVFSQPPLLISDPSWDPPVASQTVQQSLALEHKLDTTNVRGHMKQTDFHQFPAIASYLFSPLKHISLSYVQLCGLQPPAPDTRTTAFRNNFSSFQNCPSSNPQSKSISLIYSNHFDFMVKS